MTMMRCRCFRPFLTIPIGAIIFGQSSGPIVFWCYFQLKDRCLAMIFVWKPKNRVFYNMLNFAPNCAYISALGVKKKHQNKEESMTWEAKSFFWDWLETFVTDEDTFKQAIFDWIVWHLLWAAIKAEKLLSSSKSDGFQCHNYNLCHYFCLTNGID